MTITHDMDEKDKTILETLAGYNSYEYNLRKLAEEASEISTVILQIINKPGKKMEDKLIEELGDLELRLKIVKHLVNKEELDKRKRFKLNNWTRYLEQKSYREI